MDRKEIMRDIKNIRGLLIALFMIFSDCFYAVFNKFR